MEPTTGDRGRGRFRRENVRVLNIATADSAYKLLRRGFDVPMLLAFLDRFDHLGWLPPHDEEKRRLLAAHDVIMHVVSNSLAFYEFCSKGARGERNPWLTIFFHVDPRATVRICGVYIAPMIGWKYDAAVEVARTRVVRLDRKLRP